jgi:NADH-quinone oxidoreductase subunit L
LSGLPPLSGFFSKEALLGAVAELENPVWLAAGLFGVFLTAYYAFRLIFIILFPRGEVWKEPMHDKAMDTGTLCWAMGLPLLILASVTVVLGFLEIPLREFLSGGTIAHAYGDHSWLPYISVVLAVLGVGVAWLEFGRRAAPQVGFVERLPVLRELFAQRWYLDHVYRRFVDTVIDGLFSRGCAKNEDRVINASIDGFCHFMLDSGHLLSFLQSGKLRYNLIVMFAALALAALYFLFA